MATYEGVSKIDASAGDGSDTSVTIPSGATVGVVQMGYFHATIDWASVTVDGQTPTTLHDLPAASLTGAYAGIVSGFTTGASKTVSWTWTTDAAITEGGIYYITWWSGVETTAKTSDAQRTSGTTNCSASVSSIASGDTLVVHIMTTSNFPELTDGSLPTVTSVYDDETDNSNRVDLDYFTSSATSYTLEMTGENYPTFLVVVLEDSAAGGAPTILSYDYSRYTGGLS